MAPTLKLVWVIHKRVGAHYVLFVTLFFVFQMFFYYAWLPSQAEPDYSEGFTCDSCGVEAASGPLFHSSELSKDFCIPCGISRGMHEHQYLACSLLFTSADFADAHDGAVVQLGYKISSTQFGVLFGNGRNLVFHREKSGILLCTDSSVEEIDNDQAIRRFPWLYNTTSLSRLCFDREITLSLSPPRASHDQVVALVAVTACSTVFKIEWSNGIEQLFESQSGVEMVLKNGVIISYFEGGRPVFIPKADALVLSMRCLKCLV